MHPGVSVKQPDYKTLSLSTKSLKASVIASSGLRPSSHVDVLVAGSLAIDLCCDYTPGLATQRSEVPQASTSNPALISQSLGGVGANLATAIHYLGASARLCSAVADDLAGHTALEMLHQRGLETSGVKKLGSCVRTAQYVAVNDANKDLVLAMADMSILEETETDFEQLWQLQVDVAKPKWLMLDANWSQQALQEWISAAKAARAKVAFEPVSAAKCKRLFPKSSEVTTALPTSPQNVISLAAPNALELASMHAAARDADCFERADWWHIIDSMGLSSSGSRDKLVSMTNASLVDQGVPQQSLQLLPFIPTILTKLGSQGVLMTQLLGPHDIRLTSPSSSPHILTRSLNENGVVGGVFMRLFPPAEIVPTDQVISVNGAGDTFLGVIMAGLAQRNPRPLADLVQIAQQASVMTLKSRASVSPSITTLRAKVEGEIDSQSYSERS